MIIEDNNGKYYIDDKYVNKTSSRITIDNKKMVPFALYTLHQEVELKHNELKSATLSDAELLQWAKDNNPNLQNKISIQTKINELDNEIKKYE